MKQNKIIILIILAIIISVGTDIFLVYQRKKETGTSNEEPQIVKRISCYREDNIEASENQVGYQIKDEYSFFIKSDNQMSPDIYNINLYFNTLEDLNAYYTYAIDTLKLIPAYLSKNEQDLSLLYSRSVLQGGHETYEEKVLGELQNVGYSCYETNLDGIEE